MSDLFPDALAHHKAGRLEQAAALYQQILAADPAHADSYNLLGVVLHQRGRHDQAVQLIVRALQLRPDVPAYYVNLATALRALGQHDRAANAARSAIAVQPYSLEAHLLLGQSLQALKQWADAQAEFRWLVEQAAYDSRGPQALANWHREQNQNDEAIVWYREALARNANDAAAQLGLGTTLAALEKHAEAEPHLRRATELAPGVAAAWTNLGSCLMKLGRDRDAVPVFEKALNLSPNDVRLGVNLGQAYQSIGKLREAANCFRAVLDFQPDHAPALELMAEVHRALDQPEEAIPLFERANQLAPSRETTKGLASALWEANDIERALTLLREAIAADPNDADAHVRLAVRLATAGEMDEAVTHCRTALRIRPNYVPALVELAKVLRGKLPADERAQLQKALQQPLSESVRSGVHFGCALVADALDDYATAAEHLRQGNALAKSYYEACGRGYSPEVFVHQVDQLIDLYTPEFFARVRDWGIADERPVFVVGMPRSGTTLVEQILSCHPQVYGAGELRLAYLSLVRHVGDDGKGDLMRPMSELTKDRTLAAAQWHLDRLRELDGGRASRVIDKMPDNYLMLGWLAMQFPKARVIHCRRDVRDVALSCWTTSFARARWADDLNHLAERINHYRRVMAHWRRVLPLTMLEIDYEQLVANQEAESRRLVEFLGLPWDPACLAFHTNKRLVKTASVAQVRQPMYARSVGRWKHYEEALRPLLQALET